MVNSILNPKIVYEETKRVEKNDIGYDATQFEIELYTNIASVVALGNVNYTYAKYNILYIPVYLIKNSEVKDQIGVYEFLASQYTDLLDEENDIDVGKLDNPLPLYYSFFNEKFLKTVFGESLINLSSGTPIIPGYDKEERDEEVQGDEWSSPNSPTVLDEILGDDSKKLSSVDQMTQEMREREAYKPQIDDSWIKKYLKNGSYSIQDNEGDGDCLFAVIRDAFRSINKEKSVLEIRTLVSDAATEKDFQNFKEHYDMYNTELSSLTAKQLIIRDKIQLFKVQFSTAENRAQELQIANEAKQLTLEYKNISKEKVYAKGLIHEFKWMSGITDLNMFKTKIKTCDFWAEGWAINILENVLKVKLVILSSQNYKDGDLDNVLQCGDFVDDKIVQEGKFVPKYYIITSYRGDHYMLIKYNGTRIFTFESLPYTIKQMILSRCLEDVGGKGIYNMIPEFNEMNQIETKSTPATDSGAEDIGLPSEEKSDEGYKQMKNVVFDKDTIFQFYSKSSGKTKPGKGVGEKIKKERSVEFGDLATIPDWRKVLSNFYITKVPFVLDGKHWTSVEHFYHASKFKKDNPEFYNQFSIDSKSELSKDPAMAKGAGGKTGKYKGKILRPKGIKIDDDFFSSGENEKAMFRGQMSKYNSDLLAKKVLLSTKNAKLQHFVRANPPIIFYNTMKVRDILQNET